LGKRFIDGLDFYEMVAAGAAVLQSRAENVNALNVFPVPDGDTGTNMSMTMAYGAGQLKDKADAHIGRTAEMLSKELLKGARGNSGVILSQLFRGFAKSVHDLERINAAQFAAALQQGVDTAYQAVKKPVEGTILTVSREAAKHAAHMARRTADLALLMEEVHRKAEEVLAKTPDMLPVLKQVGVVDSGGQGLVYVYEGFLRWLKGESGDVLEAAESSPQPAEPKAAAAMFMSGSAQSQLETGQIEFPYDMEFFIHLADDAEPFDEDEFRAQLSRDGDSILVIADGADVKVHVHSRKPGDVLNLAMRYGELSRFHIENMRETHRSLIGADAGVSSSDRPSPAAGAGQPAAKVSAVQEAPQPESAYPENSAQTVPLKPFGMVSVAAGDGIARIMESLGADLIVSGGQTMNPSTEDLLQAVESVAAETVYVFPNNSNIIMAAEQVKELTDKRVIVIPSKTVPQGMAGLLAFSAAADADQNERAMLAAISAVRSGQITLSVRDTSIDGLDIRKGDYIGMLDGKIVASGPELLEVGKTLLDKIVENGEAIVTLLSGQDADESVTEALVSYLETAHPDVETEVHVGGQPVYHYIISAE
jgi:DAK2 domain fusion protein YloV